jgi:hypothetical protein
MAFIFGKTAPPPKPQNFAEIIAPLTDITAQLDEYVAKCNVDEADLQAEKDEIEREIERTRNERSMSDGMAARLREFTGAAE